MGNKVTTTSTPSIYELPQIEVVGIDASGSITSISILEGGSGLPDGLAGFDILAVDFPDISVGMDFPMGGGVYGLPIHTHTTEESGDLLVKLVSGQIPSATIRTTEVEEHSHELLVTWDTVLQKFIFNFTGSDNHTSGPHSVSYPTITAASFDSPVFNEGSLQSLNVTSGGSGYTLDHLVCLTNLPATLGHTHDVELEYMYQGTDSKDLVVGVDSTFQGATTSWFTTVGATITSVYDSGHPTHNSCLRIESGGINNGAYIEVDTFVDKEYNISFDYKDVVGSTQKLVVETDNGDGSWYTEATYSLVSSDYVEAGYVVPGYIEVTGAVDGFFSFNNSIYLADRTRKARTRLTVYVAGSGGGPDDEILIDNFKVSQTWVRGDTVARSITFNSSDKHEIELINNLVINTSDPTAFMEDDIFFIDRKLMEGKLFIEFELAPAWDVEGIKLPAREIIQNTCLWKYKGGECGYTGTNYFDTNDQTTTAAKDICGKRLNSCEIRFGSTATLPYGGFPGVGLGIKK